MSIRLGQMKGMSLTELLVATALIGVVILGVASVDYAVRSTDRKTSSTAVLAMTASGILLDISKNASEATGDISSLGIDDLSSIIEYQGLCIRQDKSTPQTPGDYSDDVWKCYIKESPYILDSCTLGAIPGGGPNPCSAATDHQILTANLVSFTSTRYDDPDPPGTEFGIEISITLRKDPTQAADATTNPEVTLTTRIYPTGHSW